MSILQGFNGFDFLLVALMVTVVLATRSSVKRYQLERDEWKQHALDMTRAYKDEKHLRRNLQRNNDYEEIRNDLINRIDNVQMYTEQFIDEEEMYNRDHSIEDYKRNLKWIQWHIRKVLKRHPKTEIQKN